MQRSSLHTECVVCGILIVLVGLAWTAAMIEYTQSLQNRAVVSFLVHHQAIGDDPSFIVHTAPNVEVVWTSMFRSPFFIGATALAATAISALSWLIYRLQRITRLRQMSVI